MWYEIRIEKCPAAEIESLNEYLEQGGALSITLTDKNDDPVLEPLPGTTPLWPEVVLCALYQDEKSAAEVVEDLHARFPHLSSTLSAFEDKNWVLEGIRDLKPVCFGEKLWICPDYASIPPQSENYLVLPPGLAFGTGAHPTTQLCLNWIASQDLHQKTVIDYGCGSGILALAALKSGAAKAYAVDIDQQALEATRNNAIENGLLGERLSIEEPSLLSQPVDVLIANILLGPLLDLQKTFLNLLVSEGRLIVTGLLTSQTETIIAAYASDFKVQSRQILDGWAMIEFKK